MCTAWLSFCKPHCQCCVALLCSSTPNQTQPNQTMAIRWVLNSTICHTDTMFRKHKNCWYLFISIVRFGQDASMRITCPSMCITSPLLSSRVLNSSHDFPHPSWELYRLPQLSYLHVPLNIWKSLLVAEVHHQSEYLCHSIDLWSNFDRNLRLKSWNLSYLEHGALFHIILSRTTPTRRFASINKIW